MTLAVVGTLAVGVSGLGIRAHRAVAAEEERTRQSWILDAALARGAQALLSPGDSLIELLRAGEPARWQFGGRQLMIEVTAESGKVDVNAGDPDLVRALLERTLNTQDAAAASANLRRARAAAAQISSVEQILPVADRFGDKAARLRRVLTSYSGQAAVSIESATPALLEALGMQREAGGSAESRERPLAVPIASNALERPIYTIYASFDGEASARAREMTIILNPTTRAFFLIDKREGVRITAR